MVKEYVIVSYGFKRCSYKQKCMRDFITETVYDGDWATFESNYLSYVNDAPIDWNSDYANGHGRFELLGISMTHRVGNFTKGLRKRYKGVVKKDNLHELLVHKVEAAGLDYNTLVSMYGEPDVHVESYMY